MNRLKLELILDEILQGFRSLIDERQINIIRHVYQNGFFYSNIDNFRTIFLHLIANAIAFSDARKEVRSIEINVRATSTGCSIQIKDNGIGIEKEIQNRMFEMFYCGSEKSTGAGVGLYIVREVLKKMRGSITVDSVLTHGSSFLVWVPNRKAIDRLKS